MAYFLFFVINVPFSINLAAKAISILRACPITIVSLLRCNSVSSSFLEIMDSIPRTYPPKRWNPEFLTDRKFKEETPYVKLKNDIRSVFGDIENFMQDSEESLPSDQVDEVIEFCHGVCSDDLRSGVAAGGRYQRSWLDDRGYSHETGSGLSRRYTGNSLTPSQLYQILQARVRNTSWSIFSQTGMGHGLEY